MKRVRAKKHLGQHFLKDESVAQKIAEALSIQTGKVALEIGPGMGMMTKYLQQHDLFVNEIDKESIEYLVQNQIVPKNRIIEGDFLSLYLAETFPNKQIQLIGNLPYYISSQILFVAWDSYHLVDEMVFMLQKEVAQRIASGPGNKEYGILSVLLQAFYDIEYLFTVHEGSFSPPPKVKSGIIRLVKKEKYLKDSSVDFSIKRFKQLVKQGFNNRRKTLRNALKVLNLPESIMQEELLQKRAEQLHVNDFIELSKRVEKLS